MEHEKNPEQKVKLGEELLGRATEAAQVENKFKALFRTGTAEAEHWTSNIEH
jgi:hypothetical protein